MKSILKLLAWASSITVVLYLVLRPDGGAAFTGPMGTIGIGLIGLGLCRATGNPADQGCMGVGGASSERHTAM